MTVSSVAADIQVPNGMQTLGSLVNAAQGIQAYQTGKITQQQAAQNLQTGAIQQQRLGYEQQAEQQANQDRKNVLAAMQAGDPDLKPGPDGMINQPNAIAKLQKLAPQTWDHYVTLVNQSNQQANSTNTQLLSIGREKLNELADAVGSLAAKGVKPSDIGEQLAPLAEASPPMKPVVNAFLAQIKSANGDPDKTATIMQQAATRVKTLSDNFDTYQGATQLVNNGQQLAPTITQSRFTGKPAGTTIGEPTQLQLPPSTPVMRGTTPSYLGATKGPQGALPAAPALGVAENIGGTVQAVNKDFQQTQDDAANSAKDIGVLQNIKQYAKGALTGVGADRAALLSGLAGQLGISPAELAKTNTDLLAKNANMLALAGGDTNLAKTLAEAANPNTHMTPEAIQHAADQVIAQRQLPAIKQHYMAQFKNDPETYQQKLAQWNSVADPRILQWPTMTPEEKVAMKASMSPIERARFSQKIRSFESMVGPVQ